MRAAQHDRREMVAAADAPVWLYRGQVMHARLKPFGHRFFYRVFSVLIDLDRLEEAGHRSRLFSVNRFNLVSFQEKDHGDGAGNLRDYVDGVCKSAGLPRAASILLSAFPRVMGYVFNPLSVYFLRNGEGRIYAHLYEVRNTFGGKHTYIEAFDGESSARHSARKLFHVSPFLERELRYHFTVLPPTEELRLRIVEKDEAGATVLTALYNAHRHPLSARMLLREGIALPFMSLKIILGIHWEALKLFIKGARSFPDFKRPSAISRNDDYLPAPAPHNDRTTIK